MATVFTTAHAHHGMSGLRSKTSTATKSAKRGAVATFFSDLFEDLQQQPLQADSPEKHDMFREHINAMSISYFALIILLIASSLPILAYAIHY